MTDKTINQKIKRIKTLQDEVDKLESEINKLKDSIKAFMGDFEEFETDKYIIRWTTVISNKFDTDRFKKQNRAIYDTYLKQCKSRRFTFSDKKGVLS